MEAGPPGPPPPQAGSCLGRHFVGPIVRELMQLSLSLRLGDSPVSSPKCPPGPTRCGQQRGRPGLSSDVLASLSLLPTLLKFLASLKTLANPPRVSFLKLGTTAWGPFSESFATASGLPLCSSKKSQRSRWLIQILLDPAELPNPCPSGFAAKCILLGAPLPTEHPRNFNSF